MYNTLFQAPKGALPAKGWALQAFLLGIVGLVVARLIRMVYKSAKEHRVRNAIRHFLTSGYDNHKPLS